MYVCVCVAGGSIFSYNHLWFSFCVFSLNNVHLLSLSLLLLIHFRYLYFFRVDHTSYS